MHFVGKIDLKIYRCVNEGIVTDEVIFTDKQMAHVFETHGHEQSILDVLRIAIADPDYILEDEHKEHADDTAIVLRWFASENGGYRVILRLATSADAEMKNSIITAFYISEKKWWKYIKNKKILYKNSSNSYNEGVPNGPL